MSRSLQFDIVANDKASAKLKDVQGAAEKFGKSMTSALAGFFTINALVGKLTSFFQETFTWASGLKDAAMAVGMSVENLQQLEYAAKIAGVPVEKLQKAFLDLRKTVRDASQGGVQQTAVLKALGYTQEQIATGNIDIMEAFLKVSRAMSAATTEQEKFNIATSIFGDKVAMDLIKILGNYGELKQNISEAPIITSEEAEILDQASDTLERIVANMKVMLALKLLRGGGSSGFLSDFIPGGTAGATAEAVANAVKNKNVTTVEPLTQQDKDAAKGLAEAGKKASTAALGASSNASSLAAIGGAAGFRMGAGKSPELTTLEAIEANTRPAMPMPANGSTNFSSNDGNIENQRQLNVAAAAIRNLPRRRDRAPR